MQTKDSTRTTIHDATLKTYTPNKLPDYNVFAAVDKYSTDTIYALAADELQA